MEIDSLQLGATFMLATGLVRIIELLINKFAIRNGNDYNKKTYEVGHQISTNDLSHILEAIKTQTQYNREDHQKQTEVLIEIKTVLEERK